MPRPDLDLDIPPLVTASVLLSARRCALASGISWPGIEDILAATGVSPEEAHEIEDALLDQLVALAMIATRQNLAGEDHSADLIGLALEMLRFIKQNPGCAQSEPHERYTARFRRFVLELRWRYCDVVMAEFITAIDVPLETVEDWLHGGRRSVDASAPAKDPRATRGARARPA